MDNIKGFNTTKEVYGVDPIELQSLTYEEALRIKLIGVRNILKDIIGNMDELSKKLIAANFNKHDLQTWNMLDRKYKKAKRAESFTLLLLEELGIGL